MAKKSIYDKINKANNNEDDEDLFLYSADSKEKVVKTVSFFLY